LVYPFKTKQNKKQHKNKKQKNKKESLLSYKWFCPSGIFQAKIDLFLIDHLIKTNRIDLQIFVTGFCFWMLTQPPRFLVLWKMAPEKGKGEWERETDNEGSGGGGGEKTYMVNMSRNDSWGSNGLQIFVVGFCCHIILDIEPTSQVFGSLQELHLKF
jgi:hypothetical protein